jgi:hypothetical protein
MTNQYSRYLQYRHAAKANDDLVMTFTEWQKNGEPTYQDSIRITLNYESKNWEDIVWIDV